MFNAHHELRISTTQHKLSGICLKIDNSYKSSNEPPSVLTVLTLASRKNVGALYVHKHM